MTETLGDLLRRDADRVAVPDLHLDVVLAEAGRRQRRRRGALVATSAVAVVAITAGAVAVSGLGSRTDEPAPLGPTPSTPSGTVAVDEHGTRPVVYAEGTTVHVGDRTVEARDPVAFIAPTDDGAVYQATLQHTLWFTDGTTSSVIGLSDWTAAPTAHSGNVTTGETGSLVVWSEFSRRQGEASGARIVYDTARQEVVGRVRHVGGPVLIGRDQVVFGRGSGARLYRYDVASGETTTIRPTDVGTPARTFVVGTGPGRTLDAHPYLAQVGQRLVGVDFGGAPRDLSTAGGDPVGLRLPAGYTHPGPEGSGSLIQVSQWLDDDRVVLWADDGGGDLPAKHGDLLVCRLPDGTCRVAVPRSPQAYVAPY